MFIMRKIAFGALLCMSFALLFGACAAKQSFVQKHPVELQERPLCSECHTDWRATLDHNAEYMKRHRFYAQQQKQTCNLCHKDSFCSDCHAHKEELKPSDKYQGDPTRSLPHPGDYLSQHQIDGRMDPASCFPCHGRQNNERCRTCHR
jgi:hypothetical protein